MKAKFYLLIALMFLTFAVSAQKYNFMLTENWNINKWENAMKITNTYDANGNMTKATTETWNTTTSIWDKSMMVSYTLNADGTTKESLTQMDLMDGSGMMDMTKSSFTYNASKKVLTEASQNWLGIMWQSSLTKTNTYDANGRLQTVVSQSFDMLTQQMKNYRKTDYTYNADGSSNQTTNQSWNASGQWENSSRSTSNYNASKQITSDLTETWLAGTWQNSTRMSYTYSANSQLAEILMDYWKNNAWTNNTKIIYTLNSKLEPTQIIMQAWNDILSIWENSARQTWDYNFTGIQPIEFAGKVIKVFPNPFVNELTIENGTLDELAIQMFNSNGQLVGSYTTNGSVTNKNFSSLKIGTYFIKIKSPQNEQTIKLLKVK